MAEERVAFLLAMLLLMVLLGQEHTVQVGIVCVCMWGGLVCFLSFSMN